MAPYREERTDRGLVDDHGAALMAVSYEHECLLELFRRRETLAVELLTGSLGSRFRAGVVRATEGDLGQIDPVETRADLVLLLDENGKAVFGIVVEVQLANNAEKPFRWPLYAATLRVRHACPVAVLVVTPDRTVAEWAKKPIALGSGSPRLESELERLETADVL